MPCKNRRWNRARLAAALPPPFINDYVPNYLWPAEVAVFGREVLYLPQGEAGRAVNLTVLWKDGQTDEEVFAGRYSHLDARNADLLTPPAMRDRVIYGGIEYDVVRVDASAVYYVRLVIQQLGPAPEWTPSPMLEA